MRTLPQLLAVLRPVLALVLVGTTVAAQQPAGPGLRTTPSPSPTPAAAITPQTILILGGTGFLGPQVVEAATAHGHQITLFNRGRTRPELFKDRPEIEILHGDRDGDLESLRAAIAAGRRWNAVVDTSGYVPRIVKDSATLLAPAIDQYVFISTISVFAEDVAPHSKEDGKLATMPDESSEEVMQYYGALKALCERAAEAAAPGRTTNIRPGLIVGPGDGSDRFSYWPLRVQRGGEVLAPGDGADPVQYIDVRDLAEFIVRSIEQRHFGVFNATGPERTLTMKELLEGCVAGVAADATAPASLVWVPADFLAEHEVAPWGDLPVWVPRGPDAGFTTLDCSKAVAAGLRFRPVADTVRDTLAWWRTLPEARRAKVRAGLSAEREAAVLTAWKERAAGS
ncbi:MAG: NAD-dependent epimerase/dehydratase family protein [Planctomycetota bacterium]